MAAQHIGNIVCNALVNLAQRLFALHYPKSRNFIALDDGEVHLVKLIKVIPSNIHDVAFDHTLVPHIQKLRVSNPFGEHPSHVVTPHNAYTC